MELLQSHTGSRLVRRGVDSVVPVFSNREEISITKGKWWNVSHYNEECNGLQDSP